MSKAKSGITSEELMGWGGKEVFAQAMNNIMPVLEVKARRFASPEASSTPHTTTRP